MYQYKATITYVVDGDTFDAAVDVGFSITINHRFRVIGIDTPETYRPTCEEEKIHGQQAKQRAIELLLGKDVIIESTKEAGVYNRYGAKVTFPDGKDFAQIMINEGFIKRDYTNG